MTQTTTPTPSAEDLKVATKLLDEWNDVTGFVVKNTSYYFEVRSLIEEGISYARAEERKRVEKLVEALEFYAHKDSYFDGMPGEEVVGKEQSYGDRREWRRDLGNLARTALAAYKREGGG